jgi:site-specific DNA-cytosine methylase
MDASGCSKQIPAEKLDILIAGTSCVDFSTLNNKKDQKTQLNAFDIFPKDVVEGNEESPVGLDPVFREAVRTQLTPEGLANIGESMTTFLSTLSFIMDKRPRIIILENVQTAPWKSMERFWLRRAGYNAEHVKVDSKEYYLPQDRSRGYLVAMDATEFAKYGSDAAGLVHKAILHILGLKRNASSSVLEFLLADDDPCLLQARTEIVRHGALGKSKEGDGGQRQQVDWDLCQLRHDIYEQQWDLSTVRRFSNATLSHGKGRHNCATSSVLD